MHPHIEKRRALAPLRVLQSVELRLVEEFYGEKRAKRSRAPLINHIYEGVSIMARAGAEELAQRAFCLHPLLQSDTDLKNNFSRVANALMAVPDGAVTLAFAMEYRSVADEYLAHCTRAPGGIRLSPLKEVNQMLLGDKVQNQRDYIAYHEATHPNRVRLTEYFDEWIAALLPGTDKSMVQYLTADLPPADYVWASPLALKLIPTANAESFRNTPEWATGLPVERHPGAFGVERKHHVHEGVDLYCPEGTQVFAVEPGVVTKVIPFTGAIAGMDWWEDTYVVLVEGVSGVVAYGEIAPRVKEGAIVQTGEMLGQVTRVLKKDKGRPMSMLHLELHSHGARACPEWTISKGRPETLQDPTPYLLQIVE